MKYSKKRVIKKAIPDNDPNGLVDRIQVSRNLSVKAVDVHVNIKHPYSGDISIELTGPDGTKKMIQNPTRVPGKNIVKHYNGDLMSGFCTGKSKGEWSLKVIDSGARDNGHVEDWTLDLTLANSKKSEIFIEDTDHMESVQVCHQGGKITEMTAKLDINHSHIGDLTCTLHGPTGKSVTLHSKTGGSKANLTKTFSAEDLKAFNGEVAKGLWKLEVIDSLKGDAGRLVSWGLNIKTSTGGSSAGKHKKDDLTKIEGIGPKIKELLWDSGIHSFAQLAAADPANIKSTLEDAGPRFKMHDPGSWPKQAKLAASGKWDELKKLQDVLDGGK